MFSSSMLVILHTNQNAARVTGTNHDGWNLSSNQKTDSRCMVVFTSGSGLTRINTTAVFARFTFSQTAYVNTIILVHCKSVCRCIDGTPMSGANCKSDGGLECASCNRGFKLRQDKTACDGRLLVRGVMVTGCCIGVVGVERV